MIDVVYAACMTYIFTAHLPLYLTHARGHLIQSVVDKPAVVATLVATDVRTWSFD